VKIHRNYTVEEIARLFGIHKNTVREWIKAGLPVLDDKRPMLVLGQQLGIFLQARRFKNKQSCQSGEMHCFRWFFKIPPRPNKNTPKSTQGKHGFYRMSLDAVRQQNPDRIGVLAIKRDLTGRLETTKWRRERDSNPRSPFRLSGFQDRLFQPLTHPSAGVL
jgi:hypothetical protein